MGGDRAGNPSCDFNIEAFPMNSFTLVAVGNLARDPETVTKGDVTCTRICLVGSDYAGRSEDGVARTVVTSLWFVAFGAVGAAIAAHARKGDQLILDAKIRANNWTDGKGEKQYDHSFIVGGFRFGAPGKIHREELESDRLASNS
jgi:single-stranded DNA-binding protein